MRRHCNVLNSQSGMTILEMLVTAVLSSVVVGAVLGFYVAAHDSWNTQQDVSEMQQSLRVSVEEIVSKLRNAGAGLPEGLAGIVGADTNPDTITVRFSATSGSLVVGSPTNNKQAVPIHVERFSDLSEFAVGDRVYIYRPPSGPGEFFTITKLADNSGSGWKEVHHQNEDLINNPQPNDVIIKLLEARYWIDRSSDSLHPRFIRQVSGPGEVYAEEISDLQFRYTLADGTVIDQPMVGDSIFAVDVNLAAQTVKQNLTIADATGRLNRTAQTSVVLRNRPGAN